MLKKTKFICKYCGNEFEIPNCWIKKQKNAGSYCSRECASNARIGTKSKTNKQITLICKVCGKKYNVKAYRKNTSKTCSIKCKQELWKNTMIGENSPNWKGGISTQRDIDKRTKEYKDWRKKVYERDNYTCAACKDDSGGNLHAHHILNYSHNKDLRYNIDNGITLCDKCHNPSVKGSFHNIYGTKNNTKEQLKEFLERRNKNGKIK